MVAITVILAAVIGAFVLEIGDQQETAPNTSLTSDEQVKFYTIGNGICPGCADSRNWNFTEVSFSHTGGDTLDVSQTDIKVDGNATVYSLDQGDSSRFTYIVPQPDIRPTLGSNQPVEFTSGQTWRVTAHCGEVCHQVIQNTNKLSPVAENVDWSQEYYLEDTIGGGAQTVSLEIKGASNFNGFTNQDYIKQGQQVTIVWTAESGGKTQTLFQRTVEQSSACKGNPGC